MIVYINLSISFAVFVIGGIFKYGEIGRIARLGYQRVVKGGFDCTSRLAGMRAVAIAALRAVFEYFREEVAHFVTVKFECTEPLHSGGVYQPGTILEAGDSEHLRKRSGVHSGIVG